MGVPPVDRGLLMCYNLGRISEQGTRNSVFDIGELRQYLTKRPYPLPLDLAFPAFGWYAWFRGDRFKGIVPADTGLTMAGGPFRAAGDNRYRLAADTVIGDRYFREGDLLRLEQPDPGSLREAVALVTGYIPDYGRIAFYHWNYPSTERYEHVIRQVFDRY
jgi:hypothetical protein